MNLKSVFNDVNKFRSEILFGLKVHLYFSRHNTTKFVIFAQGRTGSTLLVDLLNNHPDIKCEGELLNVRWSGKRIFPTFYVKNKAKTSKEKFYGFKVKLYQLYDNGNKLHQNVDPKEFLINLYKSGWKIIYLERNNIFRQALSNFIAESKGKYHHRNKNELATPKIKINPGKLLKSIRAREKYLCDEKEILKTIPHLKISYETDLLKNYEKAVDKVFEFLGASPCIVKTSLLRTSKDELQDYILNYKEIKDYLSKTKYLKFLK